MRAIFATVRVILIALICVGAALLGLAWYGDGKPPRVDVTPVEKQVRLDAFVSDPAAEITMSVEAFSPPPPPPSGTTPTTLDAYLSPNCGLSVSVRAPSPTENVKWVVVTTAPAASDSDSVTVRDTGDQVASLTTVFQGDTESVRRTRTGSPLQVVGSFDCGRVFRSSRGSFAAALPVLQSLPQFAFTSGKPTFEMQTPGVSPSPVVPQQGAALLAAPPSLPPLPAPTPPGAAPVPPPPGDAAAVSAYKADLAKWREAEAKYEAESKVVQAANARTQALVYPDLNGHFASAFTPADATRFYSPASASLVDKLDFSLRDYQIVTNFPANVVFSTDGISWTSNSDLEPSITAVSPDAQSQRENFSFKAGLALATAAAALIALIQEIFPDWRHRPSKRKPETTSEGNPSSG